LEELIFSLQQFPPLLVYLIVFAVAFAENIFPPSPSDLLIVFAGSLVGVGHGGFIPVLLAATLGSTCGFLVMYKLGLWFGRKILDDGRMSFLPRGAIHKVEAWFRRFGYWVIVANRFLAGTRAVVAFFAGMSDLQLGKTLLLSFISSLVWNAILISSGYTLGNNWKQIGDHLASYWKIMTIGICLLVLVFAVRSFFQNRRSVKP